MGDELVLLDGSTFFVSCPSGDIDESATHGFFHADTRHLSTWELLLDGQPVRVLTSRSPDYYSARIVATLSTVRMGNNPTVSVHRDRFVSTGVHEDLLLENHSEERRHLRVELRYGSDFADILEVKDDMPKQGRSWVEVDDEVVTLWYERAGFRRGTQLSFTAPCELGPQGATFEVELAPRGRWQTCIEVVCRVGDEVRRPRHADGDFGRPQPDMSLSLEDWLADAPRLETDHDALAHTYHQSLVDLAALRFRPRAELSWSLPAAGLPWFMALFGRDSILTAYQALPFQPRLAKATLEALAAYQAEEDDPFRDAEPGKILHELRVGELATLGESPHTPYYGSHDATPLFLILLDEYERWTGDVELVRRLEGAARAALAWLEGPADPDGDGYIEYHTRSAEGLDNQCWKDSWNSIRFADGRTAQPPIATCELEGYAYDARRRTARLAREVWGDQALATRLDADAAALQTRFERDFWSEERGHYVLALDRDKDLVDALTSNIGHLLWSGIVREDRAAQVVARLMAEDMFSGWGIRTMSTHDAAYNPIEYHNGTVWPHDTVFIAEGMRRYGFRDEASALSLALIEGAGAFSYRLPEVFAGFERDRTGGPVEYPTASSPQAWAAGTPLLALRVLLGLDVVDGALAAVPHRPPALGTLRLMGVPTPQGRIDIT